MESLRLVCRDNWSADCGTDERFPSFESDDSSLFEVTFSFLMTG